MFAELIMEEQTENATGVGFNDGDVNVVRFSIPFTPGECKACRTWFQKPGTLMAHHKAMHVKVGIVFECGECKRGFRGSHAAACHVPSCRGRASMVWEFLCNECDRGFNTAVGQAPGD